MAYGIEIKNGSNVLIIDETNRISNVINSGSVTLQATVNESPYWTKTSGNITCTGMTSGNDSEFGVWIGNGPIVQSGAEAEKITVLRYTNYYKLKFWSFTQNQSIAFKHMGLRY